MRLRTINESLLEPGKQVIGHTEFTITDIGNNQYHIDRIFVKEEDRKKGYMLEDLKELVAMADQASITLSANISPDDDNYETNLAIRRTMAKVGFKPLEMDGETYPNDQVREPQN